MEAGNAVHERVLAEVERVAHSCKPHLTAAPHDSRASYWIFRPWGIVVKVEQIVVEISDVVKVAGELPAQVRTHQFQHLATDGGPKRALDATLLTCRRRWQVTPAPDDIERVDEPVEWLEKLHEQRLL